MRRRHSDGGEKRFICSGGKEEEGVRAPEVMQSGSRVEICSWC